MGTPQTDELQLDPDLALDPPADEAIPSFVPRLPVPSSSRKVLKAIFEDLTQRLTGTQTWTIEPAVVTSMGEIACMLYGELEGALPQLGAAVEYRTTLGDDSLVFLIWPRLASALLEALLSGSPSSAEDLDRPLTELERLILATPFRSILTELTSAWKPRTSIEFDLGNIASLAKLPACFLPDEAVICLAGTIRIGEGPVDLFVIIASSRIVKRIEERNERKPAVECEPAAGRSQERLLSRLANAVLSFEADLQGSSIKLSDLVHLRSGDVLALDIPMDQAIHGNVNSQTRFAGRMVVDGRRTSFLVERLLDPQC